MLKMRRREFVTFLVGAAVWPLAARAQQSEGLRRIAILMPYPESDAEIQTRVRAFKQELRRLGWLEGANVQLDERWTGDNMDLVRKSAASLLERKPDAVLAVGGRVVPLLMEMTRSVPIIVPGGGDPVRTGWVQSLARPGGNVTGFSLLELSVIGKMLETLKQIAPGMERVAAIYNPDNRNGALYMAAFESAARVLTVEPIVAPIHGLADIEKAVASLAERGRGGVLFPPDLTLIALREQVIALMARHRLPAVYPERVLVAEGGLLFYGADRIDLFRRAASYVDRVLRGEKPSELPYQQPTKYELVINLKAATALGLEIPPTLLARADEVIE
jgi:putative tryptophan/tyrosine transport system substrate-binding protein